MIMALRDQDKLWKGMELGLEQGLEQGKIYGKRESLLQILQCKWQLPEELKMQIESQEDYAVLGRWITLAIAEETLESFQEKM